MMAGARSPVLAALPASRTRRASSARSLSRYTSSATFVSTRRTSMGTEGSASVPIFAHYADGIGATAALHVAPTPDLARLVTSKKTRRWRDLYFTEQAAPLEECPVRPGRTGPIFRLPCSHALG